MKSGYSYVNPPNWCKDALPSERGWLHPVTKELLVSIPGGIPYVHEEKKKPLLDETVKGEPLIDESGSSVGLIAETEVEKVLIDEKVEKSGELIKEVATKVPRKRTTKKET